MAGDEAHLRGPYTDIRDAKQSLNLYNLDAKVVRKNSETHVFLSSNDLALNEFRSTLSSAWTLCSGCELCSRAASSQPRTKVALYPPMILLPTNSHISNTEARDLLQQHPRYTHVAVNAPIQVGDRVRRPKIIPLVGDFGEFTDTLTPSPQDFAKAFWCTCVQNGIFQTWAPMYTMFSRGNITEKKRVLNNFALQSPIRNTTVVDLYAGIGYFTLSYAKNNPSLIYCWELNWWSVEGLLRAAKQNNIRARVVLENDVYSPEKDDCIVVFAEDNKHALQRMDVLELTKLSHINMGLLPDCHDAFPVALGLAERSSVAPVFHIHENIRTSDLDSWKEDVSQKFGNCLHVERIKSYSPGVIHVCGDFQHNRIPSSA